MAMGLEKLAKVQRESMGVDVGDRSVIDVRSAFSIELQNHIVEKTDDSGAP
jgi:hypothetical protein